MTYTEKCAAHAKLSNKTNCCTCKVVVVAVVVVFFFWLIGPIVVVVLVLFTVSIVLHHLKFCLTSLYNNINESFAFSPG